MIAAFHGVRYGMRFARLPSDADRRGVRTMQGASLAELLESLGPTYVKLGQVLSTRPDVLGPDLVGGLARLQERVRPVPAPQALRALREGLGARFADGFSHVEPEPLASGSIAQVHRATTRHGQHVVVKIRRPGIVERLEADVRLMLAVATLLERVWLRFPVRPWIEQFADAVRSQLDFEREARSYRLLRSNLAAMPDLRLPAVLPELTAPSVLTLEYLDGLQHVDATDLTREDRIRALRSGLAALYQMIFIDGVIHADLHPGNVFFRRGGECVLLDAGVVAHLTPAVRRDFVDFFYGLVANRGEDCARIIQANAVHCGRDADGDAFERDLRRIVARFSALPARDFEVTSFAMALFDAQHRHQIYSAPDFMMAIVALLGYEGIVKRVEPEMDFQSAARDVLPRARALVA